MTWSATPQLSVSPLSWFPVEVWHVVSAAAGALMDMGVPIVFAQRGFAGAEPLLVLVAMPNPVVGLTNFEPVMPVKVSMPTPAVGLSPTPAPMPVSVFMPRPAAVSLSANIPTNRVPVSMPSPVVGLTEFPLSMPVTMKMPTPNAGLAVTPSPMPALAMVLSTTVAITPSGVRPKPKQINVAVQRSSTI
jgi:hypothetical protein